LKVLSVSFPILALSVVPRAVLEISLNFRAIAIRDFYGEVAFGIVGLAMALGGAGVWSLVGAGIAQRLASSIALWVAIPWRPRFIFSWSTLREMLSFGGYAMFSGIVNKALENADYFVISRWLGAEALGFYTLAFQLAVSPQRRLTGVIRTVAFPTFSAVEQDKKKLKNGLLFGMKNLFAFLILVAMSLLLLGPTFIELLYSEKWRAAIVPLQILAISGLFYSSDIFDAMFFAVGKPQFRLIFVGIRLFVFSVCVVLFGFSYGVVGIAMSLLVSVFCAWMLSFLGVRRVIDFSVADFLGVVFRPIAIALPIFLVCNFFIGYFEGVNGWLMMALWGCIIVAFYMLGLWSFLDLRGKIKLLVKRFQE
jgi:PST family polysaccharide transporter